MKLRMPFMYVKDFIEPKPGINLSLITCQILYPSRIDPITAIQNQFASKLMQKMLRR